MTTENNNQSQTSNSNNNGQPVSLTKPSQANVGMEISQTPAPAPVPTVSVNVGFPGKLQKVLVDANANIADVLREAGIKADGYDIRMGGAPAKLDTRLPQGSSNLTILLLKPVKGNRS